MSTMKAAHISRPGGHRELVERDIPQPGAGQVRVEVEACGICHSDVLVKEGLWPGIQYPRVPGHEVAGRIDAIGSGVTEWTIGQRVGVGWHGGQCFQCEQCRRGDFTMCVNRKIPNAEEQSHVSLRARRPPMNPIKGADSPLLCGRCLRKGSRQDRLDPPTHVSDECDQPQQDGCANC
jgi:Zn-dependent alcohol dehydrogenase